MFNTKALRSHKKMGLPRMSSCIAWLLFLQIIQLSFSFTLLTGGNETDRLPLLAFKDQITNDPLGKLSSWNESVHFCEWSGVICGKRHQRVVEIDLHSSQLVGRLSPHIGNFSFLRILKLENNMFSHNIPQELGRLFRLQVLSLENNTCSGKIPVNISRCSDISILSLSGNSLTGKIPAELGSLSKLQVFFFQFNDLVGEIPSSFGNLSTIKQIFGVGNHLQGAIPNSIGQLKNLKSFSFGANNLSGIIPPSIYNLSSLIRFAVPVNQLHGSLPPDLGLTLPNLEILLMSFNQLSGPIPPTFSNASTISVIELSNNNFTGKVPHLASLSNLRWLIVDVNHLGSGDDGDLSFLYPLANKTSLEQLSINDNNFGGVLPEIVCNFSTNLKRMTFGRNQIRGSIPNDIGNLNSLDTLGLEGNQLIGFIPGSIGKLQNLGVLSLGGNKISGSIPSSVGNITSLVNVYLQNNNLQGRIPSSLGNCRNLLSLTLEQNNLSGSIPKEVISISSLSTYLDLSGNQLTGSLPLEVGKLVNLGYLNVSHNRLSGEIPRSLGSCLSLERLYMEGNFFQGPLPESLSSLKALQYLNVSYNNLTGQIPKFLGDLKLLNLDLSSNDLEGEIPVQGVFSNASQFSIWGNKKLCGGIPLLNLSRCTSNGSTKQKSSTKLILKIVIPCGFVGVVLMISSVLFYFLRKRKNSPASGPSWEILHRRITCEELLQATDRFSSSNIIGEGSFGTVYKGCLTPDGTVVAVKVLNLLHSGASKSFMAECAALTNIRHRNLVKVLTACSSIDFQGNDFRALVYEFMVNGSLEEWLYAVHISDKDHEPRSLNLIQRLKIAIDVANALEYLHHHCQMPMAHCDLKPSNVLLDGDMTAHVGDFGLAKFLSEAPQLLSSEQSSTRGVKGTIGYAAPEYGMGSEVSTYGDVYSYGILFLEMFTGKRPTDDMFKDGMNLHNFAKMALPNSVIEVLDPIVLREAGERSGSAYDRMNHIGTQETVECLISILEVGVFCSAEFPRERIDISNAAAELLRIRDVLLGTRTHRQPEISFVPEGKALL